MSSKNVHPQPIQPLSEIGLLRLPQVLQLLPFCRSTLLNGIKDGRYPAPIKIGPRAVAWRVSDIRTLIKSLGEVAQ